MQTGRLVGIVAVGLMAGLATPGCGETKRELDRVAGAAGESAEAGDAGLSASAGASGSGAHAGRGGAGGGAPPGASGASGASLGGASPTAGGAAVSAGAGGAAAGGGNAGSGNPSGGRAGSGSAGNAGNPGTCPGAGDACTPGELCHSGSITCSASTSVCTTGAALSDGTACGTNLYCLTGSCKACTPNQACQPSNICKTGMTSCAAGSAACVESGSKTVGTACGAVQSCTNNVKTAAATCGASGTCSAPITNCPNGCNAAGTDCLNCQSDQIACAGVCCSAGSACCGGVCTDITNNASSCGTCTTQCGQGAVCKTKGCVSNASCRVLKATGQSTGSGTYTLDPDGPGPIAPFSAYCDMTTNGGGYTLVVGIDAATRNHASSAAVTPANLASATGKGKFADDVIRALLATGSGDLRFDVTGSYGLQSRTWTAPTCVWDSTVSSCKNKCGPDNACIYASQPIGLYLVADPNGTYSYASTGCGGDVSLYPGARQWNGDDCQYSTGIPGSVWVR